MDNLIIQAVTAVCFAALCVQVVLWIAKLFTRNRNKRIMFLDSFKKGQFAIIYLTALPLYVVGFLHSGEVKRISDVLRAVFRSVAKVVELVVLKYEFDGIEKLMNSDPFYEITVYFCFVMAAVNLVFVALSVLSRRIWEVSNKNKIRYCPKDRVFIFGSNPRSIDIYNSDKERNKIIVDKISDNDRADYYRNDISYFADVSDDNAIKEIFNRKPLAVLRRRLYEFVKKDTETPENIVIINTEDDERNMRICRRMIEEIAARDEKGKEELFRTLRIFVFGDLKYEAIYEDIESDGCGCITFINKYKKIGADFIERYPLAYFMNENQIDYETSLVKKEVDINFFMICFGNVSRQLFLTSVSNNQFLTEGENGPEVKRVKYHIFDKAVARCNKNLNHNYYRYRDEKAEYKEEDYLPLPSLPADEIPNHFDINDEKLYTELKKCVQGENDANFVFVSFGNDLENIDMAQKLVAKRREWGKNFVIFVRAHTHSKEQEALEKEGCLFIGNESEIVYNIDKILSDRIQKIAIMRNEEYDLEDAITAARDKDKNFVVTDEFVAAEKYRSFKNWHSDLHRLMRDSNIYAALSIRAKLNLMGLDYCEVGANDKKALTEEQYMAIYAKDDMPKYSNKKAACGRNVIEYDINFRESRRRNMAILEHYRWNAYLISKGFVPATLQQIKEEKTVVDGKTKYTNGRSYVMRRHGNLTTFDGLVEYRKIVAERDGADEADKDVIKYDYQILDDLHYFLTEGGYKIIKKN